MTTIRWADNVGNYRNLGKNHTVLEFTFDNSDGSLPLTSRGRHGRHLVPEVYPPVRWEKWLLVKANFGPKLDSVIIHRSSSELIKLSYEFRSVHSAYCDQLFSDGPLLEELREANFSVAIVDLMGSNCNLALARHLDIPVIGFWNSVELGSGKNIS